MANNPGPPSDLQQALEWIGFDNQNQRDMLEAELTDLPSMGRLTHKDIRDLRDGFASQMQNEGRFYFGLYRTKMLQSMIDWINDLHRCNEEVDMDDFADNGEFRDKLNTSRDRAEVCQSEEDTMVPVRRNRHPVSLLPIRGGMNGKLS